MDQIRTEYDTLKTTYEKLAIYTKDQLKELCKKDNIKGFDISIRIKEFSSFWKKFNDSKKKSKYKYIEDIEDICGIRIICLYLSDLEQVTKIIKKNFCIHEQQDKSHYLGSTSVGYRSIHFIITIENSWLNAPTHEDLRGKKVEIQLRTVAMHAWAATEHGLGYKNSSYMSDEIRRELNLLAGHFELADRYLETIKRTQETELKLIKRQAKKKKPFGKKAKLTHKNIHVLLLRLFPISLITPIIIENILNRLIQPDTNISINKLMSTLDERRNSFSNLDTHSNFDLENFIINIINNEINTKSRSAKDLDSILGLLDS